MQPAVTIIVNITNEGICSSTAWNWVVANNFIWTAQYQKKKKRVSRRIPLYSVLYNYVLSIQLINITFII